MRRLFPRVVFSAVASRSAATLPDGFTFAESKVVDKSLTDNYEHSDILRLTLTRQDEFLLKEEQVKTVTFSTEEGDMGVFPGHQYKIAKLKPSAISVEYADGTVKKYFTSGGFAHVNNEGSCDVNTVECIPFEDLDVAAAEKNLAIASAAASSAKDEKHKAVAEIRVGLLEAVIQAVKGSH
eukprot:GILI01007657.1.p1 GENE.GILI01007657.1~~GILI01007657.1.p1  ORF type:complete len:181 (-),score=49.66 GILI01007657.1:130-672(-)